MYATATAQRPTNSNSNTYRPTAHAVLPSICWCAYLGTQILHGVDYSNIVQDVSFLCKNARQLKVPCVSAVPLQAAPVDQLEPECDPGAAGGLHHLQPLQRGRLHSVRAGDCGPGPTHGPAHLLQGHAAGHICHEHGRISCCAAAERGGVEGAGQGTGPALVAAKA